jgi:hypothetical protein
MRPIALLVVAQDGESVDIIDAAVASSRAELLLHLFHEAPTTDRHCFAPLFTAGGLRLMNDGVGRISVRDDGR